MTALGDLVGKRFHRWVVVSSAGATLHGHSLWLCRCDCGVERTVLGTNLNRGLSTSCGCRRRDTLLTHGHTVGARKKGHSPTYTSWVAMVDRCERSTNLSWKWYGGRGIRVCARWRSSFQNFLEDMGERPTGTSLDRIDGSKGYCPSNCRWATYKEQRNNPTNRPYVLFTKGHTKGGRPKGSKNAVKVPKVNRW
jgi:hypothetical protein